LQSDLTLKNKANGETEKILRTLETNLKDLESKVSNLNEVAG
jgi:hypothetical protein